jgi:hypothetical protein
VAKLRQVEVLLAQGKTATEAVRTLWLTEPTYCRWRAEYGGLKLDQVKRLQLLEQENCRLRKAVADLTLEKPVRVGKLVSAARRRGCVEHVTAKLGVSQRLACRVPPPEAMPLARRGTNSRRALRQRKIDLSLVVTQALPWAVAVMLTALPFMEVQALPPRLPFQRQMP